MVKKLLLKFVRKFYNPDLQYIDALIEDWQKKSVQFIVWIVFNGIVFYLFLFGLILIIPLLSNYIFLGSSYWIPIIVLFLGIMLWFVEELYKFFRKKYKE